MTLESHAAETALRLERQVVKLQTRIAELEAENRMLRAFSSDETVMNFIRDQARSQADEIVAMFRAIVSDARPDLIGLLSSLDRALAERRAERDKGRRA